MADRKLTFVKAGDQDASEVTISTGTHIASLAPVTARETYTVSYPSTGSAVGLKESFAAAAQAVIDDATARGVPVGQP